jgi:uncharacterized membrane protein YphA (DoxX/SURF4 family)
MAGKVIFTILRLGLGGLFLYAGVIKIWNFAEGHSATQAFFQDVLNYQMLSWDVAMRVALYLPWLEVVAGIALFVNRGTAGAAAIVAGLMVVFTAALAFAWHRGLDIACGCFGHENATADFPLLLARDLGLLAASLAVLWYEARRWRVAREPAV